MLEINPDFKLFMADFCLGWRLTFLGTPRLQGVQAFFELAGDKLRIFSAGDNVGGDKYHQFGLFKAGGLGAKQSAYIRDVLEHRDSSDRVQGVRAHQPTHDQNLIVFKYHLGINLPGVKRRLVPYINTTAGDFLADLQVDKVLRINLGRNIQFDSDTAVLYRTSDYGGTS